MLAEGFNGQVEVVGDKIRISRRGVRAFFSHAFKGDKEILISHISSVQFKGASVWSRGYIEFAFLGGQESKGGILRAGTDENTVFFTKKQQPDFEQLRDRIYQIQDSLLSQKDIAQRHSPLDELDKLASLRDRGIVSDDEFESQKQRILGAG